MSTTATNQSAPFSIVFDRVEEMDLNAGAAFAFILSVRNVSDQKLTVIPTELIYLTHEDEKIRSAGFVNTFVAEGGETLEPGLSAKVAPAVLKDRLAAVRIDDQLTLAVSVREMQVSQRTTLVCIRAKPVEFTHAAETLGGSDVPLNRVVFSSMLQRRIERFDLLEEKAGISLRGLQVQGWMDCDSGHFVTVRGEVMLADPDPENDGGSPILQLTAYSDSGGVLDVARKQVALDANRPMAIFELCLTHLVEIPAKLTIYPVSSWA